jgi:DNA-nicking Smr family endonuclease
MLSKKDQEVWNSYISNLYAEPELAFRPRKVRDEEPTILDLHGLTIQQAFHETNNFLSRHYSMGSRLVTIITGKDGKIQDEFPHWCANFSFVSELDPLEDSRGQAGAYLIHLKKANLSANTKKRVRRTNVR